MFNLVHILTVVCLRLKMYTYVNIIHVNEHV